MRKTVVVLRKIAVMRTKLFFVLITAYSAASAQHPHSMPGMGGGDRPRQPQGGEPRGAGSGSGNQEMQTRVAETRTERSGKPKTVIYQLDVADTLVNYTGRKRHAIAINGSIPAPALYFTEGDTAEVYVHNSLKVATIIHWHGLILPNQYDGVPYLTTAPIRPGETHLFKFPLVQSGTYWYHSHAQWQQQSGMYGAFVIHKRGEVGPEAAGGKSDAMAASETTATPLKEYTVLLSDWTDENPYEVDRSLHNATDWYAIRKRSTQDYGQAVKEGHFKTKLTSEWKRMLAMDVSDVAYDRFTINGKPEDTLAEAGSATKMETPELGDAVKPLKAGDKIKLHIVNGSSSTYFWLQYAGGKLTVVANDGMDTDPVEVDRMIIAVAETYDAEVTIPENGSYELRATSEDRTGSASLWLAAGGKMMTEGVAGVGGRMKKKAPVLPRLNYFAGMEMMNGMMKMNGDMDGMGMQMANQVMDMNKVMYPEAGGNDGMPDKKDSGKSGEMAGMDMSGAGQAGGGTGITLNYSMLRSPVKTSLPEGPVKVLRFDLTGNMNRYVWSINNKTVSETDKILIRKGENIRIILYNGTMMRHPMHLHGHFFRVLNGQGDYSPLKNTLDILPMETDTLEFAPTESGDWFFHCHILYHMMSGMGRIFSYADSPPNPEVPDPKMALKMVYMDDRMIHPAAKVGLESNGSDGEITLSNTRYRFQTEWRVGLNAQSGYESESHFGRYLGRMQYWFPYVGWDFRYRRSSGGEKNLFGQGDSKDDRKVFCAGVEYMLPMLVIADVRVDMKGKVRLQLVREDLPVTSRLRFNFMMNTDKEYMAGFRYILTKYFSLSTHYDSDMKFGAGVTVNY
ncbi:MAG TPA: multicopper oxidase domain-containing protein [Puia sp.]|nr:multicopper oxidase domain-containing protein [Puia sp.]